MQHIAYVGGNGHVYELYMHPSGAPWSFDDVTQTAGAPNAQCGALASWVSGSGNAQLQHIACVGGNRNVYELFMHPGGAPWSFNDASVP